MSAIRGLRQVLELSGGQKLKADVLNGVLGALENWGGHGAVDSSTVRVDSCSDVLLEGPDHDDGELDEASVELSAFTLPGLPLLASMPLMVHTDDTALDVSREEKKSLAAASDERNRQHLLVAVGAVLKQAVNTSCCTPEVL